MTDAGIKALSELKNLGYVYLGDTKATGAGVAELKKALPQALIHR